MTKSTSRITGFTLIELLVVISIIGFLSSVILYAVSQARAQARDAKRVSDIRQLATALDLYYDDHGAYPLCTFAMGGADPFCGDCDPSLGDSQFQEALQPLVNNKYLTKIPKDPLNKAWCYTYEYYTSNVPDIWSAQCSSVPVGDFYYILKFSTEKNTELNVPAWNYQRVSGKEYCFVGFKD